LFRLSSALEHGFQLERGVEVIFTSRFYRELVTIRQFLVEEPMLPERTAFLEPP
jgi:hypothetical protein